MQKGQYYSQVNGEQIGSNGKKCENSHSIQDAIPPALKGQLQGLQLLSIEKHNQCVESIICMTNQIHNPQLHNNYPSRDLKTVSDNQGQKKVPINQSPSKPIQNTPKNTMQREQNNHLKDNEHLHKKYSQKHDNIQIKSVIDKQKIIRQNEKESDQLSSKKVQQIMIPITDNPKQKNNKQKQSSSVDEQQLQQRNQNRVEQQNENIVQQHNENVVQQHNENIVQQHNENIVQQHNENIVESQQNNSMSSQKILPQNKECQISHDNLQNREYHRMQIQQQQLVQQCSEKIQKSNNEYQQKCVNSNSLALVPVLQHQIIMPSSPIHQIVCQKLPQIIALPANQQFIPQLSQTDNNIQNNDLLTPNFKANKTPQPNIEHLMQIQPQNINQLIIQKQPQIQIQFKQKIDGKQIQPQQHKLPEKKDCNDNKVNHSNICMDEEVLSDRVIKSHQQLHNQGQQIEKEDQKQSDKQQNKNQSVYKNTVINTQNNFDKSDKIIEPIKIPVPVEITLESKPADQSLVIKPIHQISQKCAQQVIPLNHTNITNNININQSKDTETKNGTQLPQTNKITMTDQKTQHLSNSTKDPVKNISKKNCNKAPETIEIESSEEIPVKNVNEQSKQNNCEFDQELTDINQIRKMLMTCLPPHICEIAKNLNDNQLHQMYLEIRAQEAKQNTNKLQSKNQQKSSKVQSNQLQPPKKPINSKPNQTKANIQKQQPKSPKTKSKENTHNLPTKTRKKVVTTVIQQIEYYDEDEPEMCKMSLTNNGQVKRKAVKKSQKSKEQVQKTFGQICSLIKSLDISVLKN